MSTLHVTPEELRAAASKLNGLAEQIGQFEGGIRSVVDSINWQGASHQSIIHGQAAEMSSQIRETQGQMRNAAGGLMAYAARIDEVR